MKTNLKLFGPRMGIMLAGLLALITAFGCKKEPIPVEKVENTLSVDLTEVTLKPEGETVRIPIETNAPLAEPKCTHDWLVAEISEENDELIITAEINTTGEGRSAIITLKTAALEGDQAKAQVTVNQASLNAAELFKFGKEEYSLNYAAGVDQIALMSEGPWELSQDLPGWVEITPTSGEGDASLTLKYKSNVSVTERPSQIIFKNTKLNCSAVLNLRQAGNPNGLNDFSHLGKGYDITGMYANDSDVKASVLDCQKMYVAGQIADPLRPNKTEEQTITGKTRSEYTENYTKSATLDVNVNTGWFGLGFKASVAANFSDNSLRCSDNSYATFRHLTKKLIIATHDHLEPADLMPSLSDEFIKDVETLDAAKLVMKYGTHVLMGLSLGGVLDYSMTADLTNQTSEVNMELAVQGGFSAGTGVKVEGNVGVNKNEYQKLTNEDSYLETKLLCRGGESQFTSTGMNNQNDTYANWLESLKEQSKWVMVDYEGNMLVPLEQFISDPAKAAAVKEAIAIHVSEDPLPGQSTKYGSLSIEFYRLTNTSLEDCSYDRAQELLSMAEMMRNSCVIETTLNDSKKQDLIKEYMQYTGNGTEIWVNTGGIIINTYDESDHTVYYEMGKPGKDTNMEIPKKVTYKVNKTRDNSIKINFKELFYTGPADVMQKYIEPTTYELQYKPQYNTWQDTSNLKQYKDGDKIIFSYKDIYFADGSTYQATFKLSWK